MPFITKNGKKFWITPQIDTSFGHNPSKGIIKNRDTVRGIPIPDYILYGKDKNSEYKQTKEQETEMRNRQKRKFQSEIMHDEFDTISKNQLAYTIAINRLTDEIYFLKRKSLIERKKKQREEYRKKYDEIEKKLQDYRV